MRGTAGKKLAVILCILLSFVFLAESPLLVRSSAGLDPESDAAETPKKLIRWVDFNVPCEAMKKAIALDILTHDKDIKLNWIELLACLAAKNGNNFSRYKDSQLDALAQKLTSGTTISELTRDLKHYGYYLESFNAILSGFVGDYELEVPNKEGTGKHWETRYGIKVFSPIAKNYPYNHYDDFGNQRSYGFSRPHLGNDLMGQVGTPIVAVEGGTVEALGWNQYGGWRIGIRSFDTKRYYYYAHLRKDHPYRKDLAVGSVVKSGDVIGYLGRTGYSRKENVNNIKTSHLHFGMQLVFDESQKECNNEIWIDVYEIVRLLDNKRCEVKKDLETKDYYRLYDIRDKSPDTGSALPNIRKEGNSMEDKKQSGYPVYTEDELGGIQQVAAATECTGLEPTPPASVSEAESYSELYNKPQQTEKVNNEFRKVNPEKRI
ncbi:Peptidase family M23 [Sporobacter termitidis DSM 10068]|uniref:Peptidase family M23 n=1 Tax=Sporobacter termitidis DSM 10068 TaxID=1123282 RepID=A0A1M5YX95_9FIRM|nr:M23 family metallopeptidase [Sporobacter termitidis]SHI16183.1 Peptidase family M23 [Sporobacter termitidis DSM 10068]